MIQRNHAAIRAHLRKGSDATSSEIADSIGVSVSSVTRALKDMPDTYIDRWIAQAGCWRAVWAVAEVPDDCPKPSHKPRDLARKEKKISLD